MGIIAGLAALVAAAAVIVAAPGLVFSGEMCGNQTLAEVRSPGGTHRAVVFERDCGATSGFSTQVSVLPAGETLPSEGGNLFVADDDHGQAPSGPGGGPVVEPVWLAENRLLIRHHPRARVFHSEARVDGVEVTYERSTPTPTAP